MDLGRVIGSIHVAEWTFLFFIDGSNDGSLETFMSFAEGGNSVSFEGFFPKLSLALAIIAANF